MNERVESNAASSNAESTVDLRGAWRPETYLLKDGTRHPVDGLIFFTEKDWTVLFFVLEGNKPMHGSGEAGTYALRGNQIVFTHRYRLSVGGAVGALEEGPRMKVDAAADALAEPCVAERSGDSLTIRFGPSGNAMTFRRSSGF